MSQPALPPQIQPNETDSQKMVTLLNLLLRAVNQMAADVSEIKDALKELMASQKQGAGHHKRS